MASTGVRARQQAANREALLAAAREVFLAEGYHGASVEKVARAAGLTIGAVYSQFGGKAELLLALLERRIDERAEANRRMAEQVGDQGLPGLARRWSRQQHEDLAWSLLVLEFRVHAARDPELNARYAALHERTLAGIAEVFGAVGGLDGDEARRVGQAVFAMGNGAVLEQAVLPGAMDEGSAADFVARLLGGAR